MHTNFCQIKRYKTFLRQTPSCFSLCMSQPPAHDVITRRIRFGCMVRSTRQWLAAIERASRHVYTRQIDAVNVWLIECPIYGYLIYCCDCELGWPTFMTRNFAPPFSRCVVPLSVRGGYFTITCLYHAVVPNSMPEQSFRPIHFSRT
jgi:hypothetical protein